MKKIFWKMRAYCWARLYGYGSSSWYLVNTLSDNSDSDLYMLGYSPKEAVLEDLSYV